MPKYIKANTQDFKEVEKSLLLSVQDYKAKALQTVFKKVHVYILYLWFKHREKRERENTIIAAIHQENESKKMLYFFIFAYMQLSSHVYIRESVFSIF